MLIILRSKNQSVVIGDNIMVSVVEVDGDEVQLSIEYPEDVSVRTGEAVFEKELAVEELAVV